jgi:hypothetical protein
MRRLMPGYELDACIRSRMTGFFVDSSRSRNRLACVMVRASSRPAPYTILLSHGNACDIGMLMPLVSNLMLVTKCNILLYDYSGYGLSSGIPTEKSIYADTQAVFHELCARYSFLLHCSQYSRRTFPSRYIFFSILFNIYIYIYSFSNSSSTTARCCCMLLI